MTTKSLQHEVFFNSFDKKIIFLFLFSIASIHELLFAIKWAFHIQPKIQNQIKTRKKNYELKVSEMIFLNFLLHGDPEFDAI